MVWYKNLSAIFFMAATLAAATDNNELAQMLSDVENQDVTDQSDSEATDEDSLPRGSYLPLGKEAYLTSTFGENRGTRYHAGFDYSTLMEEGWPVYAPENGYVKELRTSPFGYGKVMFYQGKSGKTWVFAHQSSFGAKLDAIVASKMYASKKNDVIVKPGTRFKKGDTLSFAGSSGIGNPHLHLEVRLDKDRVLNPVLAGTAISDTLDPQILAAAVWQGNDLAVSSDEAISKGCVVTPVKNEFGLYMAVKVVDYSREPKDNPMAVRRITLWRYDEKVYEKLLDTLRFSKMLDIRNELMWAEEADTASDWHYINAKLAPLSTYSLEVEDFAGHVTKRKFTFHAKCKSNTAVAQTKNQTAPVYTFLSRTMLDLFRCKNGTKYTALGAKDTVINENLCDSFPHKITTLGKIVEIYPDIQSIRYTAGAESTGDGKAQDGTIAIFKKKKYQTYVNWNAKVDGATVTQKISGFPIPNDTTPTILATVRTHTDSLDFFEFHPKGIQFKGKWSVCIDSKTANAPLYWLGETSRDWFYFSKQTGGKMRCANTNELRDVAWINDKSAPTLEFPYWAESYIGGVRQPVLKIPLQYDYAGIADGNAITVKVGNKWVAAEYDSEPREIIIEGAKLPESGSSISIQVIDEAKNKGRYDVTIPEL